MLPHIQADFASSPAQDALEGLSLDRAVGMLCHAMVVTEGISLGVIQKSLVSFGRWDHEVLDHWIFLLGSLFAGKAKQGRVASEVQ